MNSLAILLSKVIYTSVRRNQKRLFTGELLPLHGLSVIGGKRNFLALLFGTYEHHEQKASPSYGSLVHSIHVPYTKGLCGIGTAKLACTTRPHVEKFRASS